MFLFDNCKKKARNILGFEINPKERFIKNGTIYKSFNQVYH